MASDLYLTITRKEPDSDIIRTYPNAPIIVYAAGTVTPEIFSGAANQHGVVEIPSLPIGQYDLWVAGSFQRSFHFLTHGYALKFPRTLVCVIPGTLADTDETDQTEIFYTGAAGKILEIRVVIQEADASANGVVHILTGASPRAAKLTFASDSAWSVICNPGGATFGWSHRDVATKPAVAADSTITIGFNHNAGTLKGLTVEMIFQENE